MRKLRVFTAAASAVVLSLGLAACGRSGAPAGETPESDGAADGGTAESQSLTMIVSTLNNPWFVSLVDGAKAAAADGGATLDVQNANDSDKTALDQMQTAITKKPGAILINPVSDDSGGAMTVAANDAGIPVLAFDRMPAEGDLASYIGFSNVESGKMAAHELAAAMGEEGTVVELMGTLGLAVTAERSQGFNEAIAEYPNITVVAQQSGDFDRGKSLNVMTNILQGNPDVTGVFAANDEMALGAISALEAIGHAGEVQVIGIDGTADAFKAIQDGTMYGTVAEPPFMLGAEVVKVALALLAGEQIEKDTQLDGEFVSKDDLEQFCKKLEDIGDLATCEGL